MGGRFKDYAAFAAIALLALLLLAGIGVFLTLPRQNRPLEIVSPSERAAPTEVPASKVRLAKVYVSGEVARPGVYSLAEGDRIEDAVAAAGGATADADLDRVNLAAKVRDQLQVHVPKLVKAGDSASASTAAGGPAGKVNLNTASAAELDTLPGIGPVTAKKIVSYRQEKGLFRTIDELKEAKLVNSSTFDKIKDLVEVR